jgi:hypothetical protein
MRFKERFLSLLSEDLKPYQKNGFRGEMRHKQQWVPDSHKTDPSLNSKIESLRNKESGGAPVPCDMTDLMYILNNYIFQGEQAPVDSTNVIELAQKHLSGRSGKELGTTGILVYLDPTTNIYKLKK